MLAAPLAVQQIGGYLGIARSTFFALLVRDSGLTRPYRRCQTEAIA